MKATEQCFPVVLFIMLYEVVLTFESLDEILKCDHSNESYWAVHSCSWPMTSSGRSGGEARGAWPPLILRPNWGPKHWQKVFRRPAPLPPYLRVWMTAPNPPLISRSLSGTDFSTELTKWWQSPFNPLNAKIKIWILICCPYSFRTEEVGRSW